MIPAPSAPANHPTVTPGPPQSAAAVFDWAGFEPFPSHFLGVAAFDASDSDQVRTYLNWGALFQKWEIPVGFPAVLDDADWGDAARTLLHDANALLDDWLAGGKLRADVVYGVWRASAGGDQVVVWPARCCSGVPAGAVESPANQLPDAQRPVRLSFPRLTIPDGPTYCAADFIKPAGVMGADESDYIGGYAIRLVEREFGLIGPLAAGHDEYRSLLATDLSVLYGQAVADYLHYRLRRFIWAYCDDDDLSNEEVLTGQQPGIRVEMGGRECPDWAEQPKLLGLLGVGEWLAGSSLEGVDRPPSMRCGYFFAHPKSRNFPSEPTGRESTNPV